MRQGFLRARKYFLRQWTDSFPSEPLLAKAVFSQVCLRLLLTKYEQSPRGLPFPRKLPISETDSNSIFCSKSALCWDTCCKEAFALDRCSGGSSPGCLSHRVRGSCMVLHGTFPLGRSTQKARPWGMAYVQLESTRHPNKAHILGFIPRSQLLDSLPLINTEIS